MCIRDSGIRDRLEEARTDVGSRHPHPPTRPHEKHSGTSAARVTGTARTTGEDRIPRCPGSVQRVGSTVVRTAHSPVCRVVTPGAGLPVATVAGGPDITTQLVGRQAYEHRCGREHRSLVHMVTLRRPGRPRPDHRRRAGRRRARRRRGSRWRARFCAVRTGR